MAEEAVARPRVFISSTIAEFRDLREALKYWLEEMGFEVQLSEHNDFKREPDAGTLEACFNNIRECNYYLLLIGGSKGSFIDPENRLSVTRQEYRTAMGSWEESGKPKLLTVIRRETMAALRERRAAKIPDEASSEYLQDPGFVREFVGEVRKEAQAEDAKKGKVDHPVSNWLAEFATFRELTDLLRATLGIRGTLQRAAVLENLQHELKRNLRLGLLNLKPGIMPKAAILNPVREQIVLTRENYLGEQLSLNRDELKGLMLYRPTDADAIVTDALDEAIRSGVLLEYDVDDNKFTPSALLGALYDLRDETAMFRRRHAVFFDEYKKVGAAWFQVRESGGTAGVPPLSLLTIFSTHDAEANVFSLMLAILRHLYGHTEDIEFLPRSHSPMEGEDEKMEDETVSSDSLEEALRKDSLWLRLRNVPDEKTQKAQAESEALMRSAMGEERYEAMMENVMEKIGESPPETSEDAGIIVGNAFREAMAAREADET